MFYSSPAKANSYKAEMGERLRKCRLISQLTQENMAELLDISVKHYSEVERGITGLSIDNLVHLSELLHVSVDYLLKGDETTGEIPYTLIECYQQCPDNKKEHLLELVRRLTVLLK